MFFACTVNVLVALFVISAVAYMLRYRCSGRRSRQAKRELRISHMSGLVMGAVLLGFQAIVQPQVRHMIVEEQREEDLESDPNQLPGNALLRHHLRQIRKGEAIDHLTVRVDP